MQLYFDEIKEMIKRYVQENKSATELAKIYKCTTKTILNRLRKNNVEIKNTGYWHKKVEFEQIKNDYEILKLSTTQIAEKYNMSPSSVWERLKKGGVQIKNQKEAIFETNHKIPLSEHPKICDLYLNDKTQNCGKIAKIYNVHKTTICAILKKNNILLERKGTRNPSWKGGITPLHTKIRHSLQYEDWRNKCFQRDNYTCQIDGSKGRLNVHHIKSFSKIFNEFLLINKPTENENLLLELAMKYEPFWDINNGKTISEEMHKYLHKNYIDIDLAEKIKVLYDKGLNRHRISKELNLEWHKVDRIIRIFK